MSLDVVETLCELVAIPSVNPMGRDLEGPEFFEYRVTEYLEGLFDRLGMPWQRQRIEEKRDNIVARLDGDLPLQEPGSLVMFEAHQDTVPVDGMTIDPFAPEVRDGRVYGRGSCDIKGGMAAMLAAIARVAETRPAGRPTIVMACTVNEEHGYSGASELHELWENGSQVIPKRPDAAIVAEPTLLDVVVAHKGAVRWRCHTRGKAAHSSQPHLGVNAAYRMARVLLAIETYQRDVMPTFNEHPLVGGPTISVGTIQGGISVNTVPDECSIEIDRRLIPGEDAESVRRDVIDFVAQFPGIDFEVEHEPAWLNGATLSDDNNGVLSERLLESVRSTTGGGTRCGVSFGTDAARIAPHGVPTVVFGPGSIDQAHTCDEWLSIEQLQLASDILFDFAGRGLRG